MDDLGECKFTKSVEVRLKDVRDMTGKERSYWMKQKALCALPQRLSLEEQLNIDEFERRLKEGEEQDGKL